MFITVAVIVKDSIVEESSRRKHINSKNDCIGMTPTVKENDICLTKETPIRPCDTNAVPVGFL